MRNRVNALGANRPVRGAFLLCTLLALVLWGWYRVRYAAYSAGVRETDAEVLWAVVGGVAFALSVIITVLQTRNVKLNNDFSKGFVAIASMFCMLGTTAVLAWGPIDTIAHHHAVENAVRQTNYSLACAALGVLSMALMFFTFKFFGHNMPFAVMVPKQERKLSIVEDDRTAAGQ